MTGWRKLADELREDSNAGHDRHNRHNSPPVADPLALVREWQKALDGVDPARPAFDLDPRRFRRLVEDAQWVFEHFARRAACDGWSAVDLFGVLPGRDAWGGVADRLGGSRSVVMTADLALWRRLVTGSPESYARGAGGTPRLVVLWQNG